MLSVITKFNERRRERRKKRSGNAMLGPQGCPVDMPADNVATILAVKPYSMTTPERLNGLCDAVKYISRAGIEGDIVECGCGKAAA